MKTEQERLAELEYKVDSFYSKLESATLSADKIHSLDIEQVRSHEQMNNVVNVMTDIKKDVDILVKASQFVRGIMIALTLTGASVISISTYYLNKQFNGSEKWNETQDTSLNQIQAVSIPNLQDEYRQLQNQITKLEAKDSKK